jgi:hypothetical protein
MVTGSQRKQKGGAEQRDGKDMIWLHRFGVASTVFSQAAATAAASLG